MRNRRAPPEVQDPWKVLDLPVHAGEQDIREAYLKKVRAFPPDRSPEQFERVRDAYAVLKDPRRRMQQMLLLVDPEQELTRLLDQEKGERRFVGPGPWLEALKKTGPPSR